MKKKYLLFLLIGILHISCHKNNIEQPIENECYFSGNFGEDQISVHHGNGIYFANGIINSHYDTYFTFGENAKLANPNGIKIPYLKVEFGNLTKLSGQYSQNKIDSVFPFLFVEKEYNFTILNDTSIECSVYIEYQDKNGKIWNSLGKQDNLSTFKINTSNLVNSTYYSYKCVEKVEGIFSCILYDVNYKESIRVENIKFNYLYFSD